MKQIALLNIEIKNGIIKMLFCFNLNFRKDIYMIKKITLLSVYCFFSIYSTSSATQDDKKDNPNPQPKTTTTTQGGGTKTGGTQTGQTNVDVNKDVNCILQ